jgi:hypothetical protein
MGLMPGPARRPGIIFPKLPQQPSFRSAYADLPG